MPTKKKRYNSRFPPARIKKIMQSDEEIGKVAAAVPVIISRTIERFIHSLVTRAGEVTVSRNVRTLTPSHIKQSILSQPRLSFMLNLCKDIPDSGSDQILSTSELPSNSLVKKEIKDEKLVSIVKNNQLKRSTSAPASSLPKRKRGRPRKEKSFVDEDNNENAAISIISNSSSCEENEHMNHVKPVLSSAVSNLNLSDVECKQESKSFLENIKISIPGLGSSSLAIGKAPTFPPFSTNSTSCPASASSVSYNPFTSSLNTEVDEDYD